MYVTTGPSTSSGTGSVNIGRNNLKQSEKDKQRVKIFTNQQAAIFDPHRELGMFWQKQQAKIDEMDNVCLFYLDNCFFAVFLRQRLRILFSCLTETELLHLFLFAVNQRCYCHLL